MTDETTGAAAAPTEEQMLATIAAHGTEPVKVPEPKADEPEAEADEPGADTAAAPTEGEAPAKPKQTVQERIDEVTRARREAERENDRLRGQIEVLTRQPGAQQPQAQSQGRAEDAEPRPDEYVHGEEDLEYILDLATHRALTTLRKEGAAKAQQEEAKTTLSAHAEREKGFAAKTPDYIEVVVDGEWACTKAMGQAIVTSDVGPEVAYHLAKNPAEAARIAALDSTAQIREIGRLEGRLTPATPAPATAAPAPKTVTTAPEPAPTLRGNNGRFEVAADTSDFKSFEGKADAILAGR